jgi:hypothetical protein
MRRCDLDAIAVELGVELDAEESLTATKLRGMIRRKLKI